LSNQKKSRIRIRLTREGWIYLTILLFISVGAVLRNINLLIVLSGMMIAPLMLGWRLCAAMLSKLTLQRNLPPWVHAGQKFDVEWQCVNNKSSLPAWSLQLDDFLQVEGNEPLKKCTSVSAILGQVNPGQTEYTSYRCLFPQRGLFWMGPTRVSTRFPMGLVRGSYLLTPPIEFCVAPQLGSLKPRWDQRLQSEATGSTAIRRRRGVEEDEFYALRPWRSGDSRRQIHWRSTAKQGEPIIKQFDQKSDRDFALAIDLFAPSLDPDGNALPDAIEFERTEKVLSFSATVVAQLRNAVHGRVGISVCGHESFFCSEQNNRELVGIVMKQLAVAQGAGNTGLKQGIIELYSSVSPGTPIIVISTRSKPTTLSDEFSQSGTSMAMLEKWIRWIKVDSPEFHELFIAPETQDSTVTEPRRELADAAS
jgi:uncharacterized protein (DUF58 family)